MSWIEKLYKTYEQCIDAPHFSAHPLVPLYHTTQQAHVEVTIDAEGKFKYAKVIDSPVTVFPATEKSMTGRTAGIAPHALCEQVKYCALDYRRSRSTNAQHSSAFHTQLHHWCDSQYAHAKAKAVLSYVDRATLVEDLVEQGVLILDDDGKLATQMPAAGKPVGVLKQLTKKQASKTKAREEGYDQGGAFIRWRVQGSDANQDTATWNDPTLVHSWIQHCAAQEQTNSGLCMVTGEETSLTDKHPKNIRHGKDGAKLISSNDAHGFTFRGRFANADQACSIGLETSLKVHNALRWLVSKERKQAFHNGDQVYVAWAVNGKPLPPAFVNSFELFSDGPVDVSPQTHYEGDAGQAFGKRLSKLLSGYGIHLGPTDDIVILGLDSAVPGRMAILYYRELTGSEFLDRINAWHTKLAWPQRYTKDKKTIEFIGTPAPNEIAEAAYGGLEKDKHRKLLKATIERLMSCIIDDRPLPRDLVEGAVRRACNRTSFKKSKGPKGSLYENEWETQLGIACSLVKGWNTKHTYHMGLEEDRTTRDYLYGRLLAIADRIEGMALSLAKESRDTSAARLMNRFADRPFSTWPNIVNALAPYRTRLKSTAWKYLKEMEDEMDVVMNAFRPGDFINDGKLSGEFLLGYHCQRSKPRPEGNEQASDNETREALT